MGLLCSRSRHHTEDTDENAQAAEIERRIEQEAKAEKHIRKLLLLGAGESGKSTIFKQIKLLFQTGFDEGELKSYVPVIHANVYQTIKLLHDGTKEFAQNETGSAKYMLSSESMAIGEKLSEIGGRLDYPRLTKDLAEGIETLWKDPAIQETCARGNELQVPDCTKYLMENLKRLSDMNYIPTKEDVLYARVRTTGVVEIQFSPVGENKKSGEVYRLFDVGGQRNERRKWIHLFEGVTAVIFCAAISEYDQTLFEDEQKNRMMETKELFDWVLKQPCFEKTSFMYSAEVWTKLMGRLLGNNFSLAWDQLVMLLQHAAFDRTKLFTYRYVLQASIYHIWMERNRRRHGEVPTPSATLAKVIDKTTRNRFSSIRNKGDNSLADGLSLWFSTRPQ